MSMKNKKNRSVVESDDEVETSGTEPWQLRTVGQRDMSCLDESVDNLSMEVHLGEDNSRHPSEISSVSYQNLLDEGEQPPSITSRRGSDDSLDSYPTDYAEGEVPPEDMETFEASDLPLSEHFPMGALQKAVRGSSDRNISPSPHPSVKLKGSQDDLNSEVTLRDKRDESDTVTTSEDEVVKKRNSLEVRNNIPVLGEVKSYDSIDFLKTQALKPLMVGVKQSPGLARRVDEAKTLGNGYNNDTAGKLSGSRSVIEVITPAAQSHVENEYDYVKYSRVQQGSSYVGMRLAYSSSNDSLNLRPGGVSLDSSREPSPDKILQKKILSEKVSEENLTEIPLHNSEYAEDKKAGFTLSPENTECDSVEVESVTSEGGNSTPGFPTVEDGLSSSQASDEEGAIAHQGVHMSPTHRLREKQRANVEQSLMQGDEDENDVSIITKLLKHCFNVVNP